MPKLPGLEYIPRLNLMASLKRRRHGNTSMFKYAATALKLARKLGRVRTTTRRNNEGPASAITTQKDSMSIYRRRRAPRKVRMRARKRYKRFIKNQLIAHKDNTNLFNEGANFPSLINEQVLHALVFGYMATNGTTDDVGDWNQVFENFINATVGDSSKSFYVTGLNYDITITNRTGSDAPTSEAVACELDIYEFVYRKDKYYNNSEGTVGLLKEALADEALLPGATNKMLTTDVGYTPFDSNQAMKYIVIKSKQRYYLPRGESVSFIKNIKFNRPIKLIGDDFKDIQTNAGDFLAKGGLTRGLIFISKGTSTQDLVSAVVGSTALGISVQCRYKFKVVDNEPNRNAQGF